MTVGVVERADLMTAGAAKVIVGAAKVVTAGAAKVATAGVAKVATVGVVVMAGAAKAMVVKGGAEKVAGSDACSQKHHSAASHNEIQ